MPRLYLNFLTAHSAYLELFVEIVITRAKQKPGLRTFHSISSRNTAKVSLWYRTSWGNSSNRCTHRTQVLSHLRIWRDPTNPPQHSICKPEAGLCNRFTSKLSGSLVVHSDQSLMSHIHVRQSSLRTRHWISTRMQQIMVPSAGSVSSQQHLGQPLIASETYCTRKASMQMQASLSTAVKERLYWTMIKMSDLRGQI